MFTKFIDNFIVKRVLNNSLYSLTEQIVTMIINFSISILFARFLGVSILGIYSLGITLVGILSILSNFGISTIMAREVAKSSKKAKLYLGNVLGIKFLISFPLLFSFTIIAVKILDLSQQYLIIICLICVHTTLLSALTYITTAYTSLHKNKTSLKIFSIYKIITLIGVFCILELNYGIQEILIFFILLSLVTFFISIKITKSIIPHFKISFDYRFNKILIISSMPLVLAAAAEYINLRIDNFFLYRMMGSDSLGYYSVASNIYLSAIFIPIGLIKIFFPNFIDLFNKKRINAFEFFKNFSYFLIVYSLFSSMLIYYFSDKIILNLYGNNFGICIQTLKYFCVGFLFFVLRTYFNYVLLALKKNYYFTRITICGTIVNIILNYFCIKNFGINGAVISTIITEFVVMLLGLIKINKTFNL